MTLTEQQKNNIYHLDLETQLEIMNICSESLGIVLPSDYCRIMNVKRTSLHEAMLRTGFNPETGEEFIKPIKTSSTTISVSLT